MKEKQAIVKVIGVTFVGIIISTSDISGGLLSSICNQATNNLIMNSRGFENITVSKQVTEYMDGVDKVATTKQVRYLALYARSLARDFTNCEKNGYLTYQASSAAEKVWHYATELDNWLWVNLTSNEWEEYIKQQQELTSKNNDLTFIPLRNLPKPANYSRPHKNEKKIITGKSANAIKVTQNKTLQSAGNHNIKSTSAQLNSDADDLEKKCEKFINYQIVQPDTSKSYKEFIQTNQHALNILDRQYKECKGTKYEMNPNRHFEATKKLRKLVKMSEEEWKSAREKRWINKTGAPRNHWTGWGVNEDQPGPDFKP